jgi:quinol monooxygenase YgiN
MSLPVLLGFAGVLVAAVVTGLLAGRCARQPRMGFIAWTGATLALTAALAAESTGFASGFGSATFRAVQLFALLLAPLWAAWGLAELLWPNEAARFGARLVCGALTVIGCVILATDPLTAHSFGKSWPPAGQHYQPPSHYVLDAAQAVAVITAVTTMGLAAVWATNDRQRRGALAGAALVGLAVLMLVAQRFSLPARSLYPLIGMAAAALVWFGAVVLDKPAVRAGRDRRDRQAGRGRRDGREARDREPDGYENQVAANGYRGPDSGGSHPPGDPGEAGQADPARRPAVLPGAGPGADQAGAVAPFGARAQPGGSPAAASSRPYGRILIFTLLDDRVADFDRFAEQAAEEIRSREPGTLVYVIHLVPNAPMQRIFYEIYRDREAFDHHERQPYMQRFVAERRSCVLATNVIELRLKYAKVAPLPDPQPPVAAGSPRPAQPPPGQPLPGQPPRQPPGQPSSQPPGQPPPGTRRAQALEPLPPGPSGPPGPDRRMPSAGRRHGGS